MKQAGLIASYTEGKMILAGIDKALGKTLILASFSEPTIGQLCEKIIFAAGTYGFDAIYADSADGVLIEELQRRGLSVRPFTINVKKIYHLNRLQRAIEQGNLRLQAQNLTADERMALAMAWYSPRRLKL